jgi:hypothetical protein
MSPTDNDPSPPETADHIAKTFFRVTDEATQHSAIRQLLIGAAECALLIPALFYMPLIDIRTWDNSGNVLIH